MAASEEEIILRLQQQVSGPAEQAIASLARLEAQVKQTKTALDSAGGGGAGISGVSGELKKLEGSLRGGTSGATEAAGALNKVESSLLGGGKAAGSTASSIRALGQGLRVVDGEAGKLVGNAGKLIRAFGKTGVAGVAIIAVVAVLALAAGLAYAAYAFAKFALESSNATRNVKLGIESLDIADAQAKALAGTMEELRKTTGVSADDQTKLLEQLKEAHLAVSDAALRALAIAKAGGGEKAVEKVVQALKNGVDAQKALSDAQAKWGKLVAEKMLDLGAQSAKFHGDIANLFAGINIEPFLKALQKLLSLFDESTVTGHALKQIITAIGQQLIDWGTAAIPYVIAGIKQLIIWGLKLYITMVKFFRSTEGQVLLFALKAIGVVLGVLIAGGALMMATLTAAFLLPAAGIAALIALIDWLIDTFVDMWTSAKQAFDGLSEGPSAALGAIENFVGGFIGAGESMVQGLIQGVASGAGAFVQSLLGMAQSGIAAVKAALGISSPSRVFAQLGVHTVAGFAQGVDQSNDNAVAATSDMANAAAAGAATNDARSVKAAAKDGSSGKIVYIENLNLGGGKDQWEEFRAFLQGEFEVQTLSATGTS